jgi:hypothetical protein
MSHLKIPPLFLHLSRSPTFSFPSTLLPVMFAIQGSSLAPRRFPYVPYPPLSLSFRTDSSPPRRLSFISPSRSTLYLSPPTTRYSRAVSLFASPIRTYFLHLLVVHLDSPRQRRLPRRKRGRGLRRNVGDCEGKRRGCATGLRTKERNQER